VEWAKFLYSYTRTMTIDGVITIDQHVVEELMRVVGPIQVKGIDVPITVDNVSDYMRSAKVERAPADFSGKDWDRKQFITLLADPLIKKIFSADNPNWKPLSQLFFQLLDEKHILLQFNDPEMSALIDNRSWDGAVKPDINSDYLMVVDTNVGFNKTNALMETKLDYTIDLSDLGTPTGSIAITLHNKAQADSSYSQGCIQLDRERSQLDYEHYPTQDCYWSYLRVYTPEFSKLVFSTPYDIPVGSLLRNRSVPVRFESIDENITGLQAFGRLLLVPKSQTLNTDLTYQLPLSILTPLPASDIFTYRLKIQKQPGTKAIPFSFHLILPAEYEVAQASPELKRSDDPNQREWIITTNLDLDLKIEIRIRKKI
jgi:hypothetical protein